ncbi:TraB/GumN family protein [Luteimonas sp. XNQY3]|nr:TraB/GumN family protein [Luteimonas sp. XNQY3]MCD9006687.1 TraB/GumN family protein [Luteimonas sp. XNQY3]
MRRPAPLRFIRSCVLLVCLFAGGAGQAELPPLEAPTTLLSPVVVPADGLQDTPAIGYDALAPAPVPLLWRVSGEQGALYLLGSFHFLTPADYPLSEDVARVVSGAGEVVFELAPEELHSPTLGLQMMQAGLRADGSKLDDEIPAQTATQLRAWAEANAASLQAAGGASSLQLFEPWFVSLLVTTTELGRFGLQAQLGMDAQLARQAQAAGTPTAGLESAQQQIALLDGMGRLEQTQMLQEALEQAGAGPESIQALHDTWRAGDTDALWQDMGLDMQARFPALYARINTERNDAWLPKLEQMLQQPGDILVVVGALHLVGPDGVVEKLAAKGYTVERVCAACAPAGAKPDAISSTARTASGG